MPDASKNPLLDLSLSDCASFNSANVCANAGSPILCTGPSIDLIMALLEGRLSFLVAATSFDLHPLEMTTFFLSCIFSFECSCLSLSLVSGMFSFLDVHVFIAIMRALAFSEINNLRTFFSNAAWRCDIFSKWK